MPTNLAAKFKQAMEDPTLLEYREQIALLSARRWAVLEAGESQLLWARAVATFNELEGAIKSGDKALMNASLLALRDLTHRGHDDSLRWREVYDLIEREGRTKEREHKRLAQMEAMISAEQFLAFVGLIVNVITQNVKDKDVLRSIARSIDALWISQGIGATNTVH